MVNQTPESRFYTALGSLFLNWFNLETFHHAAGKGARQGQPVADDWLQGFAKALNDPVYGPMLKQAGWILKPGMQEKFAKAMGARAARLASISIDSAALIFGHTILDETLSETCRISFAAEPKVWWRYIDDKDVKLRAFQTQSLENICNPLAEAYVTKLTKSSMTDRLKHLNRVLAPRFGRTKPLPTASIDFKTLYSFDQLRHRLVHRNPFKPIRHVQEKLLFAKQASFSALWLVGGAYGLHTKAPEISERAQKRLCVVVRREFSEIFELLKESVAEQGDINRGSDMR